jgi:4-amino-4-deoxy-L-arabinose transferase-like glycosyltransferase
LLWLAAPLVYFLYFFRLAGAGLVGPDEPRYAWIGRAMAQTGDWITPRLWGQPWFEKPALLYWMTGIGFRLGLGPETAPRLPIALLSVGFLAFYWLILAREFGCRVAYLAVLILGSSAAWVGFSQTGVPDLPLTATFSAAMLLALPWIHKRDARFLPVASAMLGFAVLAKGLVPLALAAPLALRIRWFRDLLRPQVLLPFFVVAAPWYVLCYLRNGSAFTDEFFLRHHFGRFTSGELQHLQPWWFYLTRLPLLLLPWTPVVALPFFRRSFADPRRRFLAAWALFGLALFSASANKLPGYVLPLLPAIAVLAALALEELENAAGWLAVCAALLVVFPIAAPLVPAAVANEWDSAPAPAFHWTWLLPAIPLAAVWILERGGRRIAAALTVATATAVSLVYLKVTSQPELARMATAKELAREAARRPGEICAEGLKRDWEYGLRYYIAAELPRCEANPKPFHILQTPGQPPRIALPDPVSGTERPSKSIDRR